MSDEPKGNLVFCRALDIIDKIVNRMAQATPDERQHLAVIAVELARLSQNRVLSAFLERLVKRLEVLEYQMDRVLGHLVLD
jgi:hypothetical protein